MRNDTFDHSNKLADVEANWDKYFDAAKSGDLLGSFDALVAIGVRPVPIGECPVTGKVKIPMGVGWGKVPIQERRDRVKRCIAEQVSIGIGCQPDGYVVFDIDPPGKDRSKLATAWKEAATILLGGEDWPDTLTIATQAGCHVWFKLPDSLKNEWVNRGKLEMPLPSGGKVEFFTGNEKQTQVACAPSEGKKIARAVYPAELPEPARTAILEILHPPNVEGSIPLIEKRTEKASTGDEQWFIDRLLTLTAKTLNAEAGDRHDTYRKNVRAMAGYASGMNLEHLQDHVHLQLGSAHKQAKPEVTDYVLTETFKWAWAKGISMPLARPSESIVADQAKVAPQEFFEGNLEPATVEDIRLRMLERSWVWGDDDKKTGWFVRGSLHLVEGKEGTGKTRWMLDLVRRWQKELPWPDGTSTLLDPDLKMLYVASDSHWDQIATTSIAFGIPNGSIIFSGPKTDPYNYTDIDDPMTLAMIRHWCERFDIGLVVIDTLMAATARPLVERQEVSKIARPLRDIARDLNVAVVLIGHLNGQGETFGRAMQSQCDNVIRMEANEFDPGRVEIKSVKARWNRFLLPTLKGSQGETGWEFESATGDRGTGIKLSARDQAKDAIVSYVRQYPGMSTSDVVMVCIEKGHAKSTVYNVVKELIVDGAVIAEEHQSSTGKPYNLLYTPDPVVRETVDF